jgi:broad specificity phosphatase PhoE
MAERRIVFVRHAQPKIEDGVPSAEWSLTPEGAAAARALGERLRGFGLASIVCSPEPKAIQTAEAIALALQLPVAVDDGFAEHARRTAGLLSRAGFEEKIAALFDNPSVPVFGEETADACFARFEASVGRLSGDALVVTHGTILSIYLSRICGFAPMPFWRALALPAAMVLTGRDLHPLYP